MGKDKKTTIKVKGTAIGILLRPGGDYISLTDMVRNFDGGGALIEQWLKNKDTVLFLGSVGADQQPDFNSLEFEGIRNEAGRNSFFLSAKKWLELTGGQGLIASAGRYGGTYAHKDIAFEFGSWLSRVQALPYQGIPAPQGRRNRRLSLAWNLNRTLSKLNYRIHTDAIKARLIPAAITPAQAAVVYASEADLLNVALFGQTARQWRDANPKLSGNLREYASVEQLLVLANIEGMNAEFIHLAFPQSERLKRLNEIAIRQMQTLTAGAAIRRIVPKEEKEP